VNEDEPSGKSFMGGVGGNGAKDGFDVDAATETLSSGFKSGVGGLGGSRLRSKLVQVCTSNVGEINSNLSTPSKPGSIFLILSY